MFIIIKKENVFGKENLELFHPEGFIHLFLPTWAFREAEVSGSKQPSRITSKYGDDV